MSKFQKIDEEGFLLSEEGARFDDKSFGAEFLNSIQLNEANQLKSNYQGQEIFVEAYDQPFVARHIQKENNQITIDLPYDLKATVQLESLNLDEWDRFHGLTDKGVPFVLSRNAQMEFFELLDSFDDESVTIFGKALPTPPHFIPLDDINQENFWTNIYQTEEPQWDLKEPANFLKSVLPQLKLAKQRVLVLGCGRGHDAAYFAELGHIVTAVDFSPSAIEDAQKLYGHLPNLEFIQSDVFDLPKENFGPFDLVFEHTCYCAIAPDRRNELVKIWKKHLVPGGHLLGVFFVMHKRIGPPYGGSEFEVKQRLKDHFDFRYWTRWRLSRPRRQGKELVVYAQKK